MRFFNLLSGREAGVLILKFLSALAGCMVLQEGPTAGAKGLVGITKEGDA